MGTVSTKLIERGGDAAFKVRKRAIVNAWSVWYHEIIVTMAEQVRHENLEPDTLVSPEMGALQAELGHAVEVGHTLFGFMGGPEDDHDGHIEPV